ncbi:MAG TPA: alpha-ketoacid dehydrogenase subunit beta [Acidobacteriota bacterium]|nr:alpha-ketoacid dehydrogenase subunit beta [Acidobacteriota bacterium]
MTKINMVQAINQALRSEMTKDKSIVLMGEDVGVDGGVFRVTEGLQKDFGEERVIDTPLAEAGIIGTATGMAINGLKPIPEMQFSGFAYQAFHHFAQHLGEIRQRSNGTFSLPMVVRAPSGGGIHALEHHSESPETFFIHAQGMKVVMPSGPYDAKGLLLASIRDPDPVIFFEPKKIYRSFKEEVPDEEYVIELGKANVIKAGTDVTIVAWGAMVRLCQETLEKMPNVSAELIDLRTLWPLDMETVLASVKKTGRVVIVQEAPLALGLGSEIAAQLASKAIYHLKAPIERVASLNIPFPQYALEEYHLPDGVRLKNAIDTVLK